MRSPLKKTLAAAMLFLAVGIVYLSIINVAAADHAKKEAEYCFVVPILPDKVTDARDFWSDVSTKNATSLDQYMRSIGQTRLVEDIQTLPRGTYLVTYVREKSGIGPTFSENRLLGTPMAKYVRDAFMKFTRFDFTARANAPQVEKLWGWEDPSAKSPANVAAFAIPIKPGKANDVRKFYADLQKKMGDEVPHLRYQTISRDEAFLQHRPEGDYLVQYIESAEPIDVVMQKAIGAGTPIADYIKNGLAGFSDLDTSDPAPKVDLVYDWSAG